VPARLPTLLPHDGLTALPNPSLVRRDKGLVRHSLHQLLHVDLVRFAVAGARFVWFSRVRKELRSSAGGGGVAEHTVMHNLKGLRDVAVVRSLFLARPLSVIESLPTTADLLVVGPRTEGEILALIAHGFERRHIRALDLISYSPWVDRGDMHDMPYEDDSFDAVILGWVLAYSDDPGRAAAEVVRVLRPGGIVAVGVEWDARTNAEIEAEVGYVPGSDRRYLSTDEVLDVFGSFVGDLIVRHEPHGGPRKGAGEMVLIFSVRDG